jgi:hypothetical protein
MLINDLNGRLGSPKGSQVTVPLLADGISLKLFNKLDGNLFRVHNSFIKTIKVLRLVLPCYWGIVFFNKYVRYQ